MVMSWGQRPIQFRVWDPVAQRMMVFGVDDTTIGWHRFGSMVHSGRLMQYTGLDDKKGNPIYDGDIIQYTNGEGDLTKAPVEYIAGAFSPFHMPSTDAHCEVKPEEVLVIGNMIETPSLIVKS